VEPRGTTLLDGATERTPYLRRQQACANPATAAECYLPLVTAQNVTSNEKWGGEPDQETGLVRYAASTPDLEHVVLESAVPLAAGSKSQGVYEWADGNLELVSVLPGGAQAPGNCARVSDFSRRHVISADGDRVIWEDPAAGCEGHVYMHEAAGHRTVQLDVPTVNHGGAEFQDASTDGSRVFFTDSQQLTAGSTARSNIPDLFVFEANPDDDPQAGVVRDLTAPVHPGEHAGVISVAGVAADGSVVYAAARGVLTTAPNERGETAERGEPNLYRIERVEEAAGVVWKPTFITTLSSEDTGVFSSFISGQTTRVSPNGRWLAFMSERSLTGYDNRDAANGVRDQEVFLYDGLTQRLVCASCDPTGARPHGVQSSGLLSVIDKQGIWGGHMLAGVIPGWDSLATSEGIYQSHYLSDSGRLFFDSTDALVPQDVNGTTDVYEYEPAGVGSCAVGGAGYVGGEGGCVGLISSGISSEESGFLDASENGDDVFFMTAAQLLPQDVDNAYDVYDAHVCGAGWECPQPQAVSSPCTNTTSCRGVSEPQPTLFGAPASATFAGAGNPPAGTGGAGKQAAKCGRHRRVRHGRCVNARKSRRGFLKARVHGGKHGRRRTR
jgi:hypothetical protein